MERRQTNVHQVGLPATQALRLASEARIIRERERAREIFLLAELARRRVAPTASDTAKPEVGRD